MKKAVMVAVVLLSLLVSNMVFAEGTTTVSLTVPPNISSEVCPKPTWDNKEVIWRGVSDSRTSKEVGKQINKEKVTIVTLDPDLGQVTEMTLKGLLESCGLKFVSKADEGLTALSVEINTFTVEDEKKIFAGKSKAVSSIDLKVLVGTTSSIITVGSEIENKGLRKSGLKKLKKTLDDLFKDTLTNIVSSQSFVDTLNGK